MAYAAVVKGWLAPSKKKGKTMTTRFAIHIAAIAFATTPIGASSAALEGKEMHAMCAAANALVGAKMEPGMLADAIKGEARRHADAARRLGATQNDLKQVLEAMTISFNQKKLSWERMVAIGEECSSK